MRKIKLIRTNSDITYEKLGQLLLIQSVLNKSFEIDSFFFKSCINFLMVPFIS